tara:strand:- start:716 stop:967 length:252 start_codon:yes stop_codon:yes gene_type:complete
MTKSNSKILKHSNTLGDLIKPEVRNILEKYHRLGYLTETIGIKNTKTQDLLYIEKELKKYKDHKLYNETSNLINKLLTLNKKR